jgi:hypothetical protein
MSDGTQNTEGAEMNSSLWAMADINDMMAVGQSTCEQIAKLSMRDDAVSQARMEHMIGKAFDAHPEIKARLQDRKAAAIAKRDAAGVCDGAKRALELAD